MSLNFNGRIVENKPKFINEQGGSKLTYNFNTDSRVKRGHNFGIIYVTSNTNEETPEITKTKKSTILPNNRYIAQKHQYDKFTLQRSKENETREKKGNDKEGEVGICTEKVKSYVRPKPLTFEVQIQTDPVPPPPLPVLVWPQKTGIDEECQIYDEDLFNFDEEVKPLIHVLISKTLEDARREVLEEEELKEIIKQQEKYKNYFEKDSDRIKQLEEDERIRLEEHKKQKALKDEMIEKTKMFQKKLKSRLMAKNYISQLRKDTYNDLGKRKVFQGEDAKYYITQFIPELQNLVEENTKNDYLIVNQMNEMFKKTRADNERKKHQEAVQKEKERLANNAKIRELIRKLEEKRKQEEKERRAKIKHDKILNGLRKTIQEELVVNSEWAEDIENIYDINGYYQKNKNVTLIGGPIGQMALILNYLDIENPEFSAESKIDKILDNYLEKSHPFVFLWSKDDLEQYKAINESIENIEDIGRANAEEYKKIVNSLFENALIHDDMLQLFFDVCSEMELNEVKDLYIKIFSSLLNKFKEGTDFGQVRFLEINKEATEEIPLLCICLLGQESIPLDNPQPDNNKNRRKKNSFESYFYERTLIMPCVSDKIKIIKINKNFDKNYRTNFLECLDFLFTLEPEKAQCIETLNEKNENFIKGLLIKLNEKYKKEIVDMAINLPREGEEDDKEGKEDD